MHAQVRASNLNSKLNTLVVGIPWANFLEATFLPGWVWDTLENLRKQNSDVLGTCDNKGSLYDTESGGGTLQSQRDSGKIVPE